MQNLSVSRPGAAQFLLRDVSFTVEPGQTVALKGSSGAGKSTLLAHIARVLPVADGHIMIDGRDLDAYSETELRRVLTFVPQRSALLQGSILHNLSLAKPDLTQDAAHAVLKAVCLDDTVIGRGGLSARLEEGGAGLSGGEARRLVLARALLRAPSVLLLDEATEGLDRETARAVMAGIRAYLPDAAILVAAHRPAELEAADLIIPV